jgi:hypothetical protein
VDWEVTMLHGVLIKLAEDISESFSGLLPAIVF